MVLKKTTKGNQIIFLTPGSVITVPKRRALPQHRYCATRQLVVCARSKARGRGLGTLEDTQGHSCAVRTCDALSSEGLSETSSWGFEVEIHVMLKSLFFE